MTKKRFPAHIKKKDFFHPAEDQNLIKALQKIEDPRGVSCNFTYSLVSILFMTILASLCGADDWPQIVALSKSMKDWIGQFVDVSNGIPSEYTFKRVFSALAPKEMNKLLITVSKSINIKKEKDIINFDGKTLRGTRDNNTGLKAIHTLNAWSTERGLCIGQVEVGEKTNEITAMPELMNLLDLKGAIITADALNTQKDIAKKAIEEKADYFLPVKGNHSSLQEEIETLFEDAIERDFKGIDGDDYKTLEKNRGRIEERIYYSIDAENLPSKKEWLGLSSVGMVKRKRIDKNKVFEEKIYYISSCEVDARLLEKVTRGHWQVENKLHWVLDVIFREDHSRYRDKNGAKNLTVVRKLALNALSRDDKLKASKAAKRLVAAADPNYRLEVLKNLF